MKSIPILRFDEEQARADVVREAHEWLRTPWHEHARVKGHGVDCLTLLVEVFERTGVIGHQEVPYYSSQRALHRSGENFKAAVLLYTNEKALPPIRIPKPADIVLFRVGKSLSHAAIVVNWPTVIHAQIGQNVMLGNVEIDWELVSLKERAVFSPW
jgi:cell wall-associated NlpC family hydrolase